MIVLNFVSYKSIIQLSQRAIDYIVSESLMLFFLVWRLSYNINEIPKYQFLVVIAPRILNS